MGVLGVWLGRRLGIPHLYDMHSSLPQQLGNFRFSRSKALRWGFEQAEGYMVRGSQVVITICQELQDTVHEMGVGDRAVLIENVMGGDVDPTPGPGRDALRAAWGLTPTQPVVLYTGTFEQYQGLDLLLEASVRLKALVPDVAVLVVGGARSRSASWPHEPRAPGAPLVFTGQRPPSDVPHFVDACDVLVSPRISGHEHAPQDLLVPALGPADRRDQPAHAHAGAHRRTPRCSSSRPPTRSPRASPRSCRIARRRRDLPQRRTRLADARYSRQSYLSRTRQAYALLLESMRPRPRTVPLAGAAPSGGREPR